MQENQVSDGVDLLFIAHSEWENVSPGCGGGSSAYVAVDDDSIVNVADPNTGNNYLIGDGSESKGEKEISTMLMEVAHCYGADHDDGFSVNDEDDNRDIVTPMLGNYASDDLSNADDAGNTNNCETSIDYKGHDTERRAEGYSDCASKDIPDGVKDYSKSSIQDNT